MKIDVGELLKEIGRSVDIEAQIERSYPEDGLILKAPIKLKIHLVNTGSGVLLTGFLETEIELECVRCLKKIQAPLKALLDEEFGKKQQGLLPHRGEVSLTENDFVFCLEDGHFLDLEEVIRQNLITSLPIKPLCDKQCKGLVKTVETKKKTDPRLAGLKDFLKKGE